MGVGLAQGRSCFFTDTNVMKRCPMVSEAVGWGTEGFLHLRQGLHRNAMCLLLLLLLLLLFGGGL